ncbi:MAG: nuclear transport factor 2 family protein [Bacteroidota bacterium]
MEEEFIKTYENALASQDWKKVAPLFSDQVSVTFSNGSVHIGKDAVQKAFERNFTSIKSENYIMKNIVWLKREANFAVYLFEFAWTGIVHNQPASGKGVGTSVLLKEAGQWKLLSEHLGSKPKN